MNKSVYFTAEATAHKVTSIIQEILTLEHFPERYHFLVFVKGGINWDVLSTIDNLTSVKVHWKGLSGPWYLLPFSFLFAGKAILFESLNHSEIVEVFDLLLDRTYVEFYFVDKGEYELFLNRVEKDKWRLNLDIPMSIHGSTLVVEVDAYSQHSETGILAIIKFLGNHDDLMKRSLMKLTLPNFYFE